MPIPTVANPIVERGSFEGKGKSATFQPEPEGSILRITLDEGEKRNGEKWYKRIAFGKDKAQAILNCIDEITDFANS